jgi:O-antigen ligase
MVQWAATLLIFFCASWWWRPHWLRDVGVAQANPGDRWYSIHYGIFPLVVIAVLAWVLVGLRGMMRLSNTAGIIWLVFLLQMAVWTRITISGDVRNLDVAIGGATEMLLMTVFIASVLANAPPLRWVIGAICAGMILQAVLGILQTAMQHSVGILDLQSVPVLGLLELPELWLDPQLSGVSVLQVDGVRWLRPYGMSAHPNLLAGALAMGLAASLAAWLRPATRSLAAVMTAFLWFALLLTFSRGALAGFAVGLGAVVLLWLLGGHLRDKSARTGLLAGVILALVVGLFFVGLHLSMVRARYGLDDREGQPATLEDMSAASRAVYLEQAKQLINEHTFTGVGIGNFAWESAWMLVNDPRDLRGNHVHNMYYLILAEIGLIGFGLFMAAILYGVGLTIVRARRGHMQAGQIALLGGVIAWLAIGWFDHYPWTQLGFRLLFWGAFAVALHDYGAGGSE